MKKKHGLPATSILLLTGPVLADDCSSLETAIRAAPSQMASLKQGYYNPGDAEAFNTSWRFGGADADSCMVSYDENDGYDVTCILEASSESDVMAQGREFTERIEACLVARGKFIATPWSEGILARFGVLRGTSAFLVPSSPQNDVQISVSSSCRTNRRGRETCSTHVTVELVGDERE